MNEDKSMPTKDQMDKVNRWKSPAARLMAYKKLMKAEREAVKIPNAVLAKSAKT